MSTAALTIFSQFSSEFGRSAMISVLPPSSSHSAATFFSSSCLLAASTTLAPAPAKVLAASAPKAPDAPVMTAVLPLTSNKASGFFRKSSDMMSSRYFLRCHARESGHPVIAALSVSTGSPAFAGDDALCFHFGGIATATTIVQTSLPRLMISRVSFGSMQQESFAFSTVSLPLTMTVNSPRSTK